MRSLCRPFWAFRWFPIHKPSWNSTEAWIIEPVTDSWIALRLQDNKNSWFSPKSWIILNRLQWLAKYQGWGNVVAGYDSCHTNISKIYFKMPYQYFRASNGPVSSCASPPCNSSNPGQPHKFAIYFYDWEFVIFLLPFNFNLLVLFCSWVKKIPFALLWYSPNDWCLELWEVVNQTHKVDGRNLWKLPCEILSCCHTLLPLKEKRIKIIIDCWLF